MKHIFILFLLLFTTINLSLASNYKLDEVKLENAFANSVDVSNDSMVKAFNTGSSEYSMNAISNDEMSKQTVAAILAFAEWITGLGIFIPVHRLVLGCGGQEFKVVALNCITLGGCGLLPLIDGIVLLVDSDGDQYIENPKFLMWAGSN